MPKTTNTKWWSAKLALGCISSIEKRADCWDNRKRTRKSKTTFSASWAGFLGLRVTCIQALKNLETWLDKAEQHAAAKGFDVGVLLTSRLAPEPSLIS
jgi:hypothetical protein